MIRIGRQHLSRLGGCGGSSVIEMGRHGMTGVTTMHTNKWISTSQANTKLSGLRVQLSS